MKIMNKKLYRDTDNKMICGVCAGLAKYLNVDVTLVRVIYAVISVITAFVTLTILYFVLVIIIPEEPKDIYNGGDNDYYQPPKE